MAYTVPDKNFIKKAFDSISSRYDLLNQILSFGMADAWRKKAAQIVLSDPGFSPKTILDLGCGTGKFLECFLRRREPQVPASVPEAQGAGLRRREPQVPASVPEAQGAGVKVPVWESAVGLDFSPAMLKKARETIPEKVLWLEEDFEKLPFLESSFDLVISGFTLRSVQNIPEFLKKVHRILTPGGKVAFLDLTRPRDFWARWFFYPYLKWFLPLIGWLVSGQGRAYQFLAQSVQNFQPSEKTIQAMKEAGFKDCLSKPFSFGTVTLIIGAK